MNGSIIASPTQIVVGVNVTPGAAGSALTVSVTGVAGPVQLLLVVSVTNTVVTLATAVLKPKTVLVGLVPDVNKVVNPASLYQL